MAILDLQNDVVLKSYATHKNVWNLVDREKFPSLKSAVYKKRSYFGPTVFNHEYYKTKAQISNYWYPSLRLFASRNIILHSQIWKIGRWNAVPKITLTSHLNNNNFTYKTTYFFIVWFPVSLNVWFCVLFVVHIFIWPEEEKWAKLIGWCSPISHKRSNVPVDKKKVGEHWSTPSVHTANA
jgi:hypothetical protein